jgi:hypothetical protein
MKQTNASKLLVVTILLNCVVLGVYVYLFTLLSDTKERSLLIEKDISVEQKKVDEMEASRAALEGFTEYRNKIDSHLVARDGIVTFVEMMEKISRDAQTAIIVDDLKPEEVGVKALPRLENVRATLTVRGSWAQVMRFASLLEVSAYHVFISGVSVDTDGSDEKGTGPTWRASFNVLVPKLK